MSKISIGGNKLELLNRANELAANNIVSIYRMQLQSLIRLDPIHVTTGETSAEGVDTYFLIAEELAKTDLVKGFKPQLAAAAANLLRMQYNYVRWYWQAPEIPNAFEINPATGDSYIPGYDTVRNACDIEDTLSKAAQHLKLSEDTIRQRRQEALEVYKKLYDLYRSFKS